MGRSRSRERVDVGRSSRTAVLRCPSSALSVRQLILIQLAVPRTIGPKLWGVSTISGERLQRVGRQRLCRSRRPIFAGKPRKLSRKINCFGLAWTVEPIIIRSSPTVFRVVPILAGHCCQSLAASPVLGTGGKTVFGDPPMSDAPIDRAGGLRVAPRLRKREDSRNGIDSAGLPHDSKRCCRCPTASEAVGGS